jgi:hypothetical protein
MKRGHVKRSRRDSAIKEIKNSTGTQNETMTNGKKNIIIAEKGNDYEDTLFRHGQFDIHINRTDRRTVDEPSAQSVRNAFMKLRKVTFRTWLFPFCGGVQPGTHVFQIPRLSYGHSASPASRCQHKQLITGLFDHWGV